MTAEAPRIVPRIVCGRRNFQKAFRNAATRCPTDSCSPALLLAPCSRVEGFQLQPSVQLVKGQLTVPLQEDACGTAARQ